MRTRYLALVFVLVGLCRCGSEPVATTPFLLDAVEAPRRETATFFDETRRALAVAPGQSVAVEARVPPNPVLRFAIAASTPKKAPLASPVAFRLSVDEQTSFEDELRRSQPNRWFRREVDLGKFAGRTVRLRFEASSSSPGSAVALWGNPVLVERGSFGARPDIILISIDCLRADHLGVYGYERDTSPNLDAFAEEATVFRHAMATSSYTLPTHASMLTGLPPSFHGASGGRPLFSSVPYAPQLLAEEGYRVSGLVSAPFLAPAYGFNRGFHTYHLLSARAPRLVDEALELLREGEGQSQFLFFHLFDVHMPYVPPREFRNRFGGRPTDITGLLERLEHRTATRDDREEAMSLYDGEIALVDRELGRFFESLKASGAFDRSLIIVTGDHGEAFFEHGRWEHGRPWSSDPGLYEEILHVPLIVKWPSGSAPSAVDDVVTEADIFATILDVAGIRESTPWSRNLRAPGGTRTLFAEVVPKEKEGATEEVRHIALRHGSLKYMSSPEKEELYDLAADPNETRNLMASGLETPVDFRALARDYWLSVPQTGPRRDEVPPDPELLEKLKALGYVEPEQ